MLLRRDDHVLVSTRLIALVIIPFLVGAFVILYCFPRHSARLFAWPIKPTMTSMMLASAYLGGAYFFVRVLWVRHWNAPLVRVDARSQASRVSPRRTPGCSRRA